MYKTLLLLSAAGLLIIGLIPEESPSTLIAFATNRDGNYEIYIMNEDGTNPRNLTCNPGQDRDPAWSPDGERIAFTSDRDGDYEIYVMDADGKNLKRLTFSPGSDRYPAWSPDGRKIVFNTVRNVNDQIYILDVGNKTVKRLTQTLSYDARATWSPDGEKIAYDSSILYQNRYPYDIYIIDTDGNQKKNLTNLIDRNTDPAWSPDGEKIAFVKRKESSYNIYVMDADGQNQVNITNNTAGNWDPAWSPDGEKIIFASDRQISPQVQPDEDSTSSERENQFWNLKTFDPPRDIYIIDINGENLKRLTNDENDPSDDIIDDTYPSWCPLKEKAKIPFYGAFILIVVVLSIILLMKIFKDTHG